MVESYQTISPDGEGLFAGVVMQQPPFAQHHAVFALDPEGIRIPFGTVIWGRNGDIKIKESRICRVNLDGDDIRVFLPLQWLRLGKCRI